MLVEDMGRSMGELPPEVRACRGCVWLNVLWVPGLYWLPAPAAATCWPAEPPGILYDPRAFLQAQAHPKLGRQLEYLGKLVRATVQAMAAPPPAAH